MADITRLNRTVIALGVIGLLLLSVAVAFIARSITTPLRDMARATQDIGTGNLDIALPPAKSGDEVGKLAEAFEYMRTSLKGYIKQLTETTAAKERIESELSIARNIQMGFLPQTFPAFPGRTEFDLHAIIEPAKEVGGDLYDYFLIDENRLFFLIGDVSDKGVPAALFMAVAKTLFKTHTLHGDAAIDGIVCRVNQELSRGNPWQMFVTAFAGILDLKTGKIIYCDGGHEPPFIIRAGKEVKMLKKKGNPALCFFDDFCFECDGIDLHPGDALVLYTDGVTEAMNGERQLFGIERIKQALQLCSQAPLAAAITRQLLEQVKSFVSNAPQSDDIAILAIRYYGPKPQEGISQSLREEIVRTIATQLSLAEWISDFFNFKNFFGSGYIRKGGLGTVEEILQVLDLIDREPEFEGEKLVIYILNRSRFWEESGLLNMLESAGYEEGKCFHVIEDIEELKSIVKEILEKKYEGKKRKKKFGENNFFDKNWQSLYILEMRFLKYQGTSK